VRPRCCGRTPGWTTHIIGWDVKKGGTPVDWVNLTFAEFNTSGPGAATARKAPAVIFTAEQAARWTPAAVLKGWKPRVPSQEPW
jgi:hypothetical protein